MPVEEQRNDQGAADEERAPLELDAGVGARLGEEPLFSSPGIIGSKASELEAARETIAQLEKALQSRIVIEQAKGVLAERLGIDIDAAFDILRRAARSHRTKLHDIAARVVCEAVTPTPVVVAIAREARMREDWMRGHVEEQRRRTEMLARQVAEQLENARDTLERH